MKAHNIIATGFILIMIASIGFGGISVAHSYQYKWRLNFAEKHLDIAQGVTDADSQYEEISKTIEILNTFPKEGNYLVYNKYYPLTDMGTAWSALYQLKNYTSEIKDLDETSSAYQLGIYNSQEKISYFKASLWQAYPTFVYWGVWGWLGDVSLILGVLGGAFSWFLLILNSFRRQISKGKRIILLLTLSVLMIEGIICYIIFYVPVFYTGPV
ncbi:MAG: hypothetical protein MCSN_3220 [Candidatus Microsyncoccus archaeolyticus]|nr:MAG: hypothetical protein MCSN_3220 [Candidatus Parcubacteria bacterium]